MRGQQKRVHITLPSGTELRVTVRYYYGFLGSYWEPPEPDEVEVTDCQLFHACQWWDFYPDEEQKEWMENHIYENANDYFDFQ